MASSPVRQRQVLAALCMLGGLLCTATLLSAVDYGIFFPFEWTADYKNLSYGIIIDAGSHGTRGHLYAWKGRVENSQNHQVRPITVPEEIFTYDPGLTAISEFLYHPNDVGVEVFAPLIHAMKIELRRLGCIESAWSKVPIYVKATAGMRNMDADTAEGIFSAIRHYFQDPKKCPFQFKPDSARVISGEEEGVFGWLAVNSQQQSLLNTAAATVGAIDLGGASTQITFMPTTVSVLEDFYAVELGSRLVRLYSHSFIGYGWDDSRMRLTTRLAMSAIFNALNNDLQDYFNSVSAEDITKALLEGRLTSFRNQTAAQKTSLEAIHLEEDMNGVAVFSTTSEHPCFAPGFQGYFDIPSLVYPDGRYFLDIDRRAVAAYMAIAGFDLKDKAVQRNFHRDLLEKVITSPMIQVRMKSNTIIKEPISQQFTEQSFSIPRVIEQISPFHPFREPIPMPKLKFRVQFNGSGLMQKCLALAKDLFYKQPCFLSSCSFNGVYQPRVDESQFLALGQFAKIRKALGIPVVSSPNSIEKRAAVICGIPYGELQILAGNKTFAPFGKNSVANLCWKSVWAYAILTHGFGFDGNSRAITFSDRIKTDNSSAESFGWSQGAMLNEISYMPWESAFGRFRVPFWLSFTTCLVLGAVTCMQSYKIRLLRNRLPGVRSDVYYNLTPNSVMQS